jgi:hypothetical protein
LEACNYDCTGYWGGDAQLDACGVCGGTNTDDSQCIICPTGQTLGCDNICYLSGTQPINDECGICTVINNYVPGICNDCADVANGDAAIDNCGVCDNNPTNDCLLDCEGTWGGDALVDDCNICDNDNTNDCQNVDVTFNFIENIYGLQFDITGGTIIETQSDICSDINEVFMCNALSEEHYRCIIACGQSMVSNNSTITLTIAGTTDNICLSDVLAAVKQLSISQFI